MAEYSVFFIAAVHFVYSFICGLSFPTLLVIYNAAVNMLVQDVCGPVFSFLGVGLLSCMVPVSF